MYLEVKVGGALLGEIYKNAAIFGGDGELLEGFEILGFADGFDGGDAFDF